MRALPHAEVGAALACVRGSGGCRGTLLAFEFLMLTPARSGEVRNARWEQIDWDGAEWTVPAEWMKAVREHRVALSPRALEVLDGAAELFDGQGLVFPSPTGRGLNHANLTTLLHELGIDAVAHGFRSRFRDWAAERADAPRKVCELALAHVNSDRVEVAYRRTGLFDRRRVLMDAWAAYVAWRIAPRRISHHRSRVRGRQGGRRAIGRVSPSDRLPFLEENLVPPAGAGSRPHLTNQRTSGRFQASNARVRKRSSAGPPYRYAASRRSGPAPAGDFQPLRSLYLSRAYACRRPCMRSRPAALVWSL